MLLAAAENLVNEPERTAAILLAGAIQATFGALGIFASIRLARYGEKLALAARLRHAGPLDEAAARETAYWWLAAPLLLYQLFVASVTLLVLVKRDLPDIDRPDIVEGWATGINTIAAMFAVAGVVMIGSALRRPR